VIGRLDGSLQVYDVATGRAVAQTGNKTEQAARSK